MERVQKKQLRRELHVLLAIDDQWHKYPESELYKEITAVGEQLANDSFLWKKRTLDKEKYLDYRQRGYTFGEIANKFNVTVNTLRTWRQENNLIE